MPKIRDIFIPEDIYHFHTAANINLLLSTIVQAFSNESVEIKDENLFNPNL